MRMAQLSRRVNTSSGQRRCKNTRALLTPPHHIAYYQTSTKCRPLCVLSIRQQVKRECKIMDSLHVETTASRQEKTKPDEPSKISQLPHPQPTIRITKTPTKHTAWGPKYPRNKQYSSTVHTCFLAKMPCSSGLNKNQLSGASRFSRQPSRFYWSLSKQPSMVENFHCSLTIDWTLGYFKILITSGK